MVAGCLIGVWRGMKVIARFRSFTAVPLLGLDDSLRRLGRWAGTGDRIQLASDSNHAAFTITISLASSVRCLPVESHVL